MQTPISTTPELDSWVYGSLAHTVEVLIDAISADAAVARVLGGPPIPGCVYIGSRGLAGSPQVRLALRHWSTDPQSPSRLFGEKTGRDTAWRLNARDPEDKPVCQEIARALAVHRCISGTLGVMLDIEDPLRCMVLFIRGADHQPFHDSAVDRVNSLAPAVGRIIHKGFMRQLQGINPASLDRTAPISANRLLERLTRTERSVLPRLLRRDTERQIALALERSQHTVHVHVKSIYLKLMVNSRKQLLDLLDGLTIYDRLPVDDPQQRVA